MGGMKARSSAWSTVSTTAGATILRGFGGLTPAESSEVVRVEILRKEGEVPDALKESRICSAVRVRLTRVLDLTDERILKELGIPQEDLLQDTETERGSIASRADCSGSGLGGPVGAVGDEQEKQPRALPGELKGAHSSSGGGNEADCLPLK